MSSLGFQTRYWQHQQVISVCSQGFQNCYLAHLQASTLFCWITALRDWNFLSLRVWLEWRVGHVQALNGSFFNKQWVKQS
jgi:hypothetical protein